LEEEDRLARQKEEEANIKWLNNYKQNNKSKLVKGSEKATEGSSKRAEGKLEQEDAKRQRIEEENESTELKRCMEIIPNDEDDVTFEATPYLLNLQPLLIIRSTKKGGKAFSKSSEQM
nr:hypothetical protein [Tanacetum cinerariifolium]